MGEYQLYCVVLTVYVLVSVSVETPPMLSRNSTFNSYTAWHSPFVISVGMSLSRSISSLTVSTPYNRNKVINPTIIKTTIVLIAHILNLYKSR